MAKDWTSIQKKFKGMWVAFMADEETVVATGKTLQETLEKARTKGVEDPIMSRMPEKLAAYVGLL